MTFGRFHALPVPFNRTLHLSPCVVIRFRMGKTCNRQFISIMF